jgi:hypothetical protein
LNLVSRFLLNTYKNVRGRSVRNLGRHLRSSPCYDLKDEEPSFSGTLTINKLHAAIASRTQIKFSFRVSSRSLSCTVTTRGLVNLYSDWLPPPASWYSLWLPRPNHLLVYIPESPARSSYQHSRGLSRSLHFGYSRYDGEFINWRKWF